MTTANEPWKRLTHDIWMSRDRNWLIRKKLNGNVHLDDLQADEFDVYVGRSLEEVKREAEKRSREEYEAILAGSSSHSRSA